MSRPAKERMLLLALVLLMLLLLLVLVLTCVVSVRGVGCVGRDM